MNEKCLVCNEKAEQGHDCQGLNFTVLKEILSRLTALESRASKLEGKKDEDMGEIIAEGLFKDMYGKMLTGMQGDDQKLVRDFLKKSFLMGKQVEKVEAKKMSVETKAQDV